MTCSARAIPRLFVFVAVLCVACKPAPAPSSKAAKPAGPAVRATVVTIRTSIQPGNRTLTHTIVILGDRARSTAEFDTWRLFDTKAKTVTFVDDVEQTIRTESLESILKRRRDATEESLPSHYRSARLLREDATRTIQGVTAKQSVIEAGAYRRELWFADHSSIPRGLFAMMTAAETPSSPLAPMMRAVDDALAKEEGFPLLEHTEIPYGETKMVINRVVTSIAKRDVPQATIVVPKGYRDVGVR
jgi:hypothetical protein